MCGIVRRSNGEKRADRLVERNGIWRLLLRSLGVAEYRLEGFCYQNPSFLENSASIFLSFSNGYAQAKVSL